MGGHDLGFDLQPSTAGEATVMQIDRWADIYRAAAGEPIPLLEEAAAWLHRGVPAGGTLGVVHGDAGPGNFVHADGKVVVVTDWEFAHLGDPAEDWAFCLTMRGARTMSREAWLDLFATHAGVRLTDDEWRYWEAFNLFKGACANRTCLAPVRIRRQPGPEHGDHRHRAAPGVPPPARRHRPDVNGVVRAAHVRT